MKLIRYTLALAIFPLLSCNEVNTRMDTESARISAQDKLTSILPDDMRVSRSEWVSMSNVNNSDKGMGILLGASPKETDKTHRTFALFLWPKGNPTDIPYETGAGSHTFQRIGSSEQYRVYYSGVSGFMRQKVLDAFCTERK